MATASDELWTALVENRERAARVARARGARAEEVEDWVQEAMARVAAMDDVDVRRVGSLVTVVVANLAVDGHRDRARATRLEDRLAARPALEPAPDEVVCDRAEAQWLWSLRDGLGTQDRRVLELRAQGRTLAEAAAELGVTYKAAENALGRARKRLRAAWAATTAILGILWGYKPKAPAAVTAVPAALVGFSTLALLSLAPPEAHDTAPWTPPAAAHVTDLRPPPEPAPPGPSAGRALRPAPPGAAEPKSPPPTGPSEFQGEAKTEPVVDTDPVEVLGYTVVPPDVQNPDDDRSAVEEVQDCLQDGPVVRPDFVGCPASSG